MRIRFGRPRYGVVIGTARRTEQDEARDAESWPPSPPGRALLRCTSRVELFVLAVQKRQRSQSDTWRTLTQQQGLSDDQAIAVMLRLTRDCEPAAPGSPPVLPRQARS